MQLDVVAGKSGSHKLHILTTLTRDIQYEKFIEDESVSHESCDSMHPNISKLFQEYRNCATPETKNH